MNAGIDSSLTTPAALIDLDRVHSNLDRMAEYVKRHDLGLRPHIKTHKVPALASEQIRRGAEGLTVATVREARTMAAVCDDILMAYPPVGARLNGILSLAPEVRVTVALDSAAALDTLSSAAKAAGRTVGVLIEMDVGMRRVGLPDAASIVALAERAARAPGIDYRGVLFYPGHIRQHVSQQDDALAELARHLEERLEALGRASLAPNVVSGGSTPAAFASHRLPGVTSIRPGTYIFNDRTTAHIGACSIDDCALTVLASVVSTAVPGQAVVDAGSKALGREPLRAPDDNGFGELLDRPEVTVRAMSEEHGILDLSRTDWHPAVGDRVRIVPNHVCYVVNLHPVLYALREGRIEQTWPVAARGWTD
jgi:D-serine deaminase-like pyridoxal phosphate-dependent protein